MNCDKHSPNLGRIPIIASEKPAMKLPIIDPIPYANLSSIGNPLFKKSSNSGHCVIKYPIATANTPSATITPVSIANAIEAINAKGPTNANLNNNSPITVSIPVSKLIFLSASLISCIPRITSTNLVNTSQITRRPRTPSMVPTPAPSIPAALANNNATVIAISIALNAIIFEVASLISCILRITSTNLVNTSQITRRPITPAIIPIGFFPAIETINNVAARDSIKRPKDAAEDIAVLGSNWPIKYIAPANNAIATVITINGAMDLLALLVTTRSKANIPIRATIHPVAISTFLVSSKDNPATAVAIIAIAMVIAIIFFIES